MTSKLKETYQRFPQSFWIITLASFIDSIGTFMILPFIYIFMSWNFGLSMVEVGFVYIILGIGNILGGIVGGSLSDKVGRKKCALFGLLVSGMYSLTFVFLSSAKLVYLLVGIMGFLGSIGKPARQAMFADILTVEKRPEGFSILRIVANLAATIGPALGGLLSSYNFKWLFIGDAITSFITAIIFVIKIPETHPIKKEIRKISSKVPSVADEKNRSKSGHGRVFKNWRYLLFIIVSALVSLTYMQVTSTLSIFLLENLSFSEQQFGLLISMNALIVVVIQFWLTKKIKMFPALIMMAVGSALYGIGFGMYGFITTIPLAFIAMIVITVGEMIAEPFNQTVTANFAPENERGRYNAVYMVLEMVVMLIGPIGAGYIMDSLDRRILWYLGASLTFIAAFGYIILYFVTKDYFVQMKNDQKSNDDLNCESIAETDVLA
ncbi:MDR family MFS transporter [Candidatus Lokiarchaeum ossiferum]